ncbi:MAG TPA: hypothetical protein VK152_02315 [Paludibacter sp.]|nr:hypothetical protein [Paludibacter sp.]
MNEIDAELKYNIRKRWIYLLFEFAHLEYQRFLWIEARYSDIIGDSTEAICGYFDDLQLDKGYESFVKEGFVTQEEAELVSEFHELLNSYVSRPEKNSLSDQNMLRDIEWINLTKLAKESWEKLKVIISDEREMEFIISLETRIQN